MKIKLLVLMLLVTALALATQPTLALGLCPPDYCPDVNAACANDGGNPTLPANTGESCYTLPSHTMYDIAIVYCQYPNGSETFAECYW